ncbi:hypothetical protein [Vibrio phage BONAISHI]|nr:hypothetical protein [Vibrio phage BONAISHI]
MPSHDGRAIRPSHFTKQFQGTGSITKVELELNGYTWHDQLFCPASENTEQTKLSLEDIVKAVITAENLGGDLLSDAIGYATGGIETEAIACHVPNQMQGEMYTFVVKNYNDVRQINVKCDTGNVTIYLTPVMDIIAAGSLVRIDGTTYLATRTLDWSSWLVTLAAETNTPVNDLRLTDVLQYHIDSDRLIKVDEKVKNLKAGDAAASLRS